MPVSVPCDRETPLAFSVQGNEELVDHEATSKAQQYGAWRHLSARGGGKILAINDLSHEVFVQQISLQGALKTLIKYLRSWAGWKLQHQRIKAELEVFQFELENWQTICNKAYWCSYFYSSVKEWNRIYLGAEQQEAFEKIKVYLSSTPVLKAFRRGVPFRLYVAIEDIVIGTVLTQEPKTRSMSSLI